MFDITDIVSLECVALGCRALYRPRHRHRHAHVPSRVPYSHWQPPHHATWHHLHYRAHDNSWYGILTSPNMLNVVRYSVDFAQVLQIALFGKMAGAWQQQTTRMLHAASSFNFLNILLLIVSQLHLIPYQTRCPV